MEVRPTGQHGYLNWQNSNAAIARTKSIH